MDIRTLPTHPGTGLTAIGVVAGRPVWPIFGAAEVGGGDPDGGGEGDDGATEDGEDDTAEEEDEADQVDAWTPPTKEEWEAHQAKLKRANTQAKNLREQLKAAGAPTGPAKATPAKVAAPAKKSAPAKPEPAEEPEATAIDDGELERWQIRAIRADAKAALLAKGCDPDLIDAPLSRLNPADIDWDGDDPDLEDWVEEMMERYPKAFAKPAAPAPAKPGLRKAPSIDQGAAANGGQATRKQPSFGETLIAAGGGLTSDGRLPGRGRGR